MIVLSGNKKIGSKHKECSLCGVTTKVWHEIHKADDDVILFCRYCYKKKFLPAFRKEQEKEWKILEEARKIVLSLNTDNNPKE